MTDFVAFADAGRALARLHLDYETVPPFPLEEERKGSDDATAYRVTKMTFGRSGREADRSAIVYSSQLTLSGIPIEAYEYQLGSRSALEWIMNRYQVKTDKASGIANDPNDWSLTAGNPRYVVDLIKRIVTVSVRTVEIVNALPSLNLKS